MRDPNQYTFDFDGRPRELTTEEADKLVKQKLMRSSVYTWLWLRANNHMRHAAIMQPETIDLVQVLQHIEKTPTSFATIYLSDLRQVLRERAQEARELVCRIEELRAPFRQEEANVLQMQENGTLR